MIQVFLFVTFFHIEKSNVDAERKMDELSQKLEEALAQKQEAEAQLNQLRKSIESGELTQVIAAALLNEKFKCLRYRYAECGVVVEENREINRQMKSRTITKHERLLVKKGEYSMNRYFHASRRRLFAIKKYVYNYKIVEL